MSARLVKYWVAMAAMLPTLGFSAEPCTFKWDASHEVALFRSSPTTLAVGAAPDTAPTIEPEVLYAMDLHPQDQVRFRAPPSKKMLDDGAYAGILKLRMMQAGRYRVAIDAGFWLDVIQDGKPLTSLDFNGSQDCSGPRKIVIYELPADADLFLQVSAAVAAQARLTVTRVAPPAL